MKRQNQNNPNPDLLENKIQIETSISHNETDVIKLQNELKRLQKELQLVKESALEKELRFNALHNASFGGIGIHDNGIILECNQGLSVMTGYSIDELIGMNGLLLISENSRKKVMEHILNGYEKPYEEFGLRKNGEEYPLRIEARNVPNNGKMVRTVEFRDITLQKKGEQELIIAKEKAQENEIYYNTILNKIGDPVFVKDIDSKLITVNDSFCEMYNLTRDEIIGKTLGEDVKPEEQEVFLKIDKQVLENGIENINEETLTIRDAEKRIISTRKTRFLDNNGVKYLIGVIRDITESKIAEKETIAAKEKAEESDRLKSAFLANMSHEIRTPMNGILGFAELLKEPNINGEKQQEYISIIERSGMRMLNIINDIVSISKIESGLMELNIQKSNINKQINYIFAFFKPEMEAKGIEFTINNEFSYNDAYINTDREKVYAILTNLVKNAIKHTEEGKIELGYRKKNNLIEFYVNDTGIGIPINRQTVIFERFIQADISDKKALQGAGLGLSISKAYAEMLGGKLWVTSKVGKGSTFYFTLPNIETNSNEEIGVSKILNTRDKTLKEKIKIVIVDDDNISKLLISIAIKDLASEIVGASTGIEAVKACQNHPDVALVLMDIHMPEMNGYDATKEIRKFNKDVIIIAQTANALESEKDKVIEAGCNDFVSKPIQIQELKKLIIKHIKN